MIKTVSNLITEREVKSHCVMKNMFLMQKIVFQAFPVCFNSKTGLGLLKHFFEGQESLMVLNVCGTLVQILEG